MSKVRSKHEEETPGSIPGGGLLLHYLPFPTSQDLWSGTGACSPPTAEEAEAHGGERGSCKAACASHLSRLQAEGGGTDVSGHGPGTGLDRTGGLGRCDPTRVQVSLSSCSGSGDDGGQDDPGTGPQGWQWQPWCPRVSAQRELTVKVL